VVLVLVLWVCANVEAMANPKMAIMPPSENNVFISDVCLGSILCEPTRKNRYVPLPRM